MGLGLGLAGKSIYDAENKKGPKREVEYDPDGVIKPGSKNPNTPTAQGWWKNLHHNKPVVQIPYKRPDDPTRPDR